MIEVVLSADESLKEDDRRDALISQISNAIEELTRIRMDLGLGFDGFLSTTPYRFKVEDHARS